jgi:hypothetical protein
MEKKEAYICGMHCFSSPKDAIHRVPREVELLEYIQPEFYPKLPIAKAEF